MATQAEVAAHLFMVQGHVSQLLKDGILSKNEAGRLDLDECREAYIRHIRAVASGHKSQDGNLDLTEERARLAKEQADAQAMKNAQLRGELLPADEVERAWGEVLRGVRSAMLAVPSRIGARLGHLTAAEVAEIDREVRDALTGAAGDDGS